MVFFVIVEDTQRLVFEELNNYEEDNSLLFFLAIHRDLTRLYTQ